MSSADDEKAQPLSAELIKSIRREALTQVAKWTIAGVGFLILIALLGWWFYLKREFDDYIIIKARGVPAGAVLAFDLADKCPEGWNPFADGWGRVIVGAGQGENLTPRPFRERQGSEKYSLIAENLPPHTHEVYRHAGKIIGDTGVPGAGSEDSNKSSQVLAGQSGEGPGKSQPYNVMPPYIALRFCKKSE